MSDPRPRRALLLVTTLVLTAAYGVVAYWYEGAAPLRDAELVLPAEARLALAGELPGRDFNARHMPVATLLAGLPMAAFGYTVDVARIVAALLVGVGLFLSAWSVARRTSRPWLGIATGFLLLASPFWVALCVSSFSVAAAIALIGVALFFGSRQDAALGGIAVGALCVGLAASVEPAALLSVPLALVPLPGLRTLAKRWLAVALALVIPAALLALQAALFLPSTLWLSAVGLPLALAEDLSVFELLVAIWRWAPAPLLVLLVGLFASVRLVSERRFEALALLCGALAPVVFEAAVGWKSGEGAAFAMPLLVVAGIVALHATGDLEDNPLRFAALLFPLIAFIYPVPPVLEAKEELASVRQATSQLRRLELPPGPLLSSIPAVAAAVDREVFRGTQLGPLSLRDPRDRGRAAQRQPTLDELATLVRESKPAAIVLRRNDSKTNFGLMFPSGRRISGKQRAVLGDAMRHSYTLAATAGNLEIHVRIPR